MPPTSSHKPVDVAYKVPKVDRDSDSDQQEEDEEEDATLSPSQAQHAPYGPPSGAQSQNQSQSLMRQVTLAMILARRLPLQN